MQSENYQKFLGRVKTAKARQQMLDSIPVYIFESRLSPNPLRIHLKTMETCRVKTIRNSLLILDICHIFYTGSIFEFQILHPKSDKNTPKHSNIARGTTDPGY